jgi:AcrR family transcriptional regulator
MSDTKQEILNTTRTLFMRYGIKSVTMDDIARELGISKKTLYQSFENKQELIERTFEAHVQDEVRLIEEVKTSARDSIDEILKIARYVIQMLRKTSPTVMYDLEKYYRRTWLQVKQLHSRHIYNYILDNIKRGIEKGLYRPELKPELIARIYVANTSGQLEIPASETNLEEMVREYTIYHIHGIATPMGIDCLNDYLESLNNID